MARVSMIKSILAPFAGGPPRREYGGASITTSSIAEGLDGLGIGSQSAMGAQSLPPTTIATAFAVIKILAFTLGGLPRIVHYRDDLSRKAVRDEKHRFVWGRPNADWRTGSPSWWVNVFAHFEGWANVYMWRARFGNRTEGLYLIHPRDVTPYLDSQNQKRFTLRNDDKKVYTPDEILHIPGLSFDGVKGIPPVQAGITAHELAISLERWGRTFLRKGSAPSGILSTTADADPVAIAQLRAQWEETHAGPDNVGSIVMVGGGAKFERVTIPPEEAQYLQSRQFSREEVLGFYAPGLPHHLLGWKSNTSNYGTGVEAQGRHLVQHVLLNRMTLVAAAISEELLPPELTMEFQVSHLLKGDARAQAEVAGKMRSGGVLSAEEWRAQVGLPPRDIPDDYLYPSNVTRVNASTGQMLDVAQQNKGIAPRQPAPVKSLEGKALLALAEARCSNEACPSRKGGAPGKLLATAVTSATIRCRDCGVSTTFGGAS